MPSSKKVAAKPSSRSCMVTAQTVVGQTIREVQKQVITTWCKSELYGTGSNVPLEPFEQCACTGSGVRSALCNKLTPLVTSTRRLFGIAHRSFFSVPQYDSALMVVLCGSNSARRTPFRSQKSSQNFLRRRHSALSSQYSGTARTAACCLV